MEFTYFKKTGELYRDTPFGREWDGDTGYNFSYEPEEEIFNEKLKQLVEEEYGTSAWRLVKDFGLFEEVGQGYRDELKDIFEEKAQESEEKY